MDESNVYLEITEILGRVAGRLTEERTMSLVATGD